MKALQNAALRRIGRRAMILTIILLLQVAIFSSFVEADSAPSIPSVKLKHSIHVRSGGLVIVNETITLFNNSTEPISSFQIGFPRDFTSNLDEVKALGLYGKELSVTKNVTLGEVSIYWMNISFSEVIRQNEEYNFSIIFAFSGLFTYIGSDPPVYGVIFPKYPALTLNAEYCEVEVSLPSGATFEGSSWRSLHHVERPLQAYSKETGYVSFSGNIQLIEGDSARREIILDAYGNAFFYDSYNIRNIGQTRISSMDFIVPKDGKDLTVYDSLGPLSFTVKEEGEAKIVNVAFRYPLRGEEGTIGYYDSSSLTLKYKLETQPHLTQIESWSAYKLRTKLFVNVDWTLKELIVKITLPEGAEFVQSSPTNNDLSKNAFTQSITYMIQRVTPIHNLDITIEYRYIMFWSAFRPALWMGIIIAVIGAVVVFRRHKRTIPMTISSESTALIRSFVEACDERMTLWIELRSLEKDVEEDRIRKKDYNRRRRIVDQRLHLITKEFTNLKEKIRRLEPRFSELVNRIEAAETEIRTLEADINGLRTQYRSGKLSRNAYEKLRDSYERRIERAKVVIEGIIIDLKGEVG